MRTLSKFKTMIIISIAVAVTGLVCMFGISYGFYRPVVGFAVMLLFESFSLVIAVLAVSKAKDVKSDNELFESANAEIGSKFDKALGSLSFTAFFAVLAVILLSLPLLAADAYSVITLDSYFELFFGAIVLILVFIYLICKKPYTACVTGNKILRIRVSKMSLIQIALTALAGIIFLTSPYFFRI